jgi:autotransporter-associated beta strand protein
MKTVPDCRLALVLLAILSAPMSMADTLFSDDFTGGSTLNQPPAAPTSVSTSYQTLVGLTNGSWSLSPGRLSLTLPSSGSVLGEIVALFASSPVSLLSVSDYIGLTVVFTNTANILSDSTANNATINIGLYCSGGVPPNQGNIVSSAGNTTGGTEDWVGYASSIFRNPSGSCKIFTRPAQTSNGMTSQNQDLLFDNASSIQAFNNPYGVSLGTTTGGVILTNGETYTLYFSITLTSAGAYVITNTLYAGAGTGGPVIFAQAQPATGSNCIATTFDGFAIGWRNASSAAQASTMDISSIVISSSSLNPPPPPPEPVYVATNGSCAFNISAPGLPWTCQWHRNGTNLLDGGNISGATSDMLIISPAGINDAAAGTNGYYCTLTGLGGYSTNSMTNSLILRPATNLVWTGNAGDTWDVNHTANWQNPDSNPTVFNFGDPVTFDDTATLKTVNLGGKYLSAASVTVDSTLPYTFQSSGSIAGPGALIYKGGGRLTLNCANTYSGGTTISNENAWLVLNNYNALGTGPVTLAKAGGLMEIVPTGNASTGIKGDIIVADDFTNQFNGNGSYAGNFFGNLFGTAGKTLFLNMLNTATNGRVRFSGTNTVMNANLSLNGTPTSQAQYYGITLAPYHPSGSQIYNGIISGNGGLVQRGSGTTILNGQNTYTGGTTPTVGIIAFGTNTVGSVTSGPIGTGPLFLAPEVPNATGGGQVMAWGGARTIANPIQYPSATNNLTLIIGGTNALTFTGPITLNGDDGTSTYTNRTFQVTNTALTTFSGVISGTGFGLIKTGKGVLALNNIEMYTGSTTVSNGALQVNGQLDAASAVVIATNATLAGTGILNGPVTVNPGGTLAPGNSIGTLTISNTLALNGNLFFELNKSLSQSNDYVLVSGTLANGGNGTLTVTNLGPVLAPGDKFYLFNQPLTGGSSLIVLGAGGTWNNQLVADGSISVAATTVPRPVITNLVASGSSIVFKGTNGIPNAPYYVMASTNMAVPLVNWTPMLTNRFDADGRFTITLPIVPDIANRFYSLLVNLDL